MKRLTTLALLAGMLSAPVLHSEDTPRTHCRRLIFRYLMRKPAARRRLPAKQIRPPRPSPRRQTSSAGFATRDAVAGCIWGR